MTRPEPEAGQDAELSFIEHLTELRNRLLRAVAAVLLVFVVLVPFARHIYAALAQPLLGRLPEGSQLVAIEVAGPFLTPIKMAFFVALLATMPYILYQAWAFVAPGLNEHEKKFALQLTVSSVFFVVVGIGFAYLFVLPAAYRFFFLFASRTGADILQDLQKYWEFTLAIFFGFGLTFQVPVVEMLLVKLGMVSQQQLREARRYVVVGAFIVAAVLTPPDVLSQFMLAVPLILLYELGIFLAGFLTARSRNPENEPEADADGSPGTQPD